MMTSVPIAPEIPNSQLRKPDANSFCQGFLPLSMLKSGQFMTLSSRSRGGLIIQKPFFADFVGPGGAVGGSFDVNCTSVYVVGMVEFEAPETFVDRQASFQHRIAFSEELARISGELSHLKRAYLMVHQLCQWVGMQEARKVPVELVARMAGVLPRTVAAVWQQQALKAAQDQRQNTGTPTQSRLKGPVTTMETLIVH